MTGGPLEMGLIILAVLLLFGYKKLPDASRSLGRSLRIFKGEMKGMKDDDVRDRHPATVMPLPSDIGPPAPTLAPGPGRDAEPTEQLQAQHVKPEDVETAHPTTRGRTEEIA
ncbi:MAG: Sec-independent protein translocase subunit TatA [Actinomycetota bacterium]|nr:Sec-independent protein translocase subunit TatA [Actinomycetota bacterium]